MSKSKKNTKLFSIVGVICGLLAVGMFFLNSVKYKVSNDLVQYFKGFQVVLGYTETASAFGLSIEGKVLDFSILALLAMLLPLAGAITLLLSVKKGDKGKLFKFIAFGCFVAGAILSFIMPSLVCIHGNEVLGTVVPVLNADFLFIDIGAILSGGLSSIGALSILAGAILK